MRLHSSIVAAVAIAGLAATTGPLGAQTSPPPRWADTRNHSLGMPR